MIRRIRAWRLRRRERRLRLSSRELLYIGGQAHGLLARTRPGTDEPAWTIDQIAAVLDVTPNVVLTGLNLFRCEHGKVVEALAARRREHLRPVTEDGNVLGGVVIAEPYLPEGWTDDA